MKYLIPLLAVLLLLLSCDSSTSSSEEGSLSGSIFLENMEDHSGITIELYNLAELDPEIVEINNDYPNIGFIINQQTEFDHRIVSPILATTTNNKGEFSFSKIATGKYNLVARRDGWGWRYIYEVNVSEGNNSLTSINEEIYLYLEQFISDGVSGNIIIEPFHHLIVDNNVIFTPDSYLELKPNSIFRINKDKSVNIYGSIKLKGQQDSMFSIVSNNLSYDKNYHQYTSFIIHDIANVDGNTIEYGKWMNGKTLMVIQNDNLFIQNNIFTNCLTAINANEIEECNINNNLLRNSNSQLDGSIIYNWANGGLIVNNIFYESNIGINAKFFSHPKIENNYFLNNYIGIDLQESNSAVFNNCLFGGMVGIRTSGVSNPKIQFNTIFAERCIQVGYRNDLSGALPMVQNNNMNTDKYYFFITHPNSIDIDAPNNYYYTTSYENILEKIHDKDDYPEDFQDDIGTVNVIPYSNILIGNSGVN